MINPTENSYQVVMLSRGDLLEFAKALVLATREDAEKAFRKDDPEWGSIDEACSLLHVSKPCFHSLVRKGLIVTRKVGERRTLVDLSRLRSDLETGQIGRYKHTSTSGR